MEKKSITGKRSNWWWKWHKFLCFLRIRKVYIAIDSGCSDSDIGVAVYYSILKNGTFVVIDIKDFDKDEGL